MIRKSILVLIEILAGFVVLVAVALGIFVWRLSNGPVSLDFLTSYIEESFARQGDGSVTLDLDETFVQWIEEERSVALRARNAQLYDRQGKFLAAIPLIGLKFDISQLFLGKVVPTSIQIIAPRLSVLRRSDGRLLMNQFDLTANNQEEGAPIFSEVLSDPKVGEDDPLTRSEQAAGGRVVLELISGLMREKTATALSYLDEVSVRQASIRFEDESRGIEVIAPRADFMVRRDDLGLKGEMSFALDLKNYTTEDSVIADQKDELFLIRGDFVFDKKLQIADLALEARGFRPKSLAHLFHKEMGLADFNLKLDLTLLTSVGLDGSVGRTRFELKGGQGSLGITALAVDPLPLRALFMRGSISPSAEKVVLDKFAVNLGTPEKAGPKFSLAGSISNWSGRKGEMTALLAARLVEMPVDQLGSYWPERLSTKARKWVTENIRTGLLNDASVKLVLKWPSPVGSAQEERELKETAASGTAKRRGRIFLSEIVKRVTEGRPELRSLEGAIRYEELEVHYYHPLPPVRNVRGTALIHGDGLTFFPEAGNLEGLAVAPSRVVIEGLQSGQEVISIKASTEGELSSALGILDHPGFEFVSRLGLDVAQVEGQSKTSLEVSFPLRSDLDLEYLDLSVESEIKNASLKGIFQGKDATESDLALRVTMQGMDVKGQLLLAGIPLSLDWRENFTPQAPFQTRFLAEVPRALPPDLEELFAVTSAPWVEGPFSLNVRYESDFDQNAEVEISANLQETVMTLDSFAWSKAKGADARLRALLSFQKGQLSSIDYFDLLAPELAARGTVPFAEARPRKIELEKLRIAQTSLQGVVVVLGNIPHITVAGGTLDATPFLKTGGTTPRPFPFFRLEARALERLVTAQEASFERVSLLMDKRPEGWHEILLRGRIPMALQSDPKRAPNWRGLDPENLDLVSFHYRPESIGGVGRSGSATRRLRLQTNDLGGMLRAMGAFDSIQGGGLIVTGKAEDYHEDSTLEGVVAGNGMRFVNVPILAKLLSFASLTGPLDILSGEGIVFDKLRGNFTLENGVFVSDDLQLYSSSIGLAGKGWVDSQAGRLDFTGVLVPAYTINRILGAIPILGTLLTGEEGGGVVAFNYSLRGTLDDPEVSVNPLSILAPGFLRRLISRQSEEIPGRGLAEEKSSRGGLSR